MGRHAMIRQHFKVESYWEVVVYFNIDYGLLNIILDDMYIMDFHSFIREVLYTMRSGKAKAVTLSNPLKHCSLVLFNRHDNTRDYINSIVHEAEHVKQAMLEAYQVADEGEPPAYTIGYLVGKMWKVFTKLL